MRKNLLKIFTIGASALAILGLASCGENDSKTDESKTEDTKTNNTNETTNTNSTNTNNSSTDNNNNLENTNSANHEGYFKVTYDVQSHGTTPKTQAVSEGGVAKIPSNPKTDGYAFKGWYTDKECTNRYDFTNEVTSDLTLYAKWKEYTGVPYDTTLAPTIYLAGDSTVQTYSESQYIGGWGQYLNWFFDEEVNVVNAARGGRSSRSFINEGRLFEGGSYSFSENGGKSIEETIKEGDYLFVQFGHNDDDTKEQSDTSYKYERFVNLGTPDSNGIYPTIKPTTKVSTSTDLPSDMTDRTKQEILKYGSSYYAYDSTGTNGTYKGYLKEYIDLARSKGAIPVLCTPVARVSFDANGKIQGGPGRHGDDFAYVKAVRQLAQEENCLLIDNFDFSVKMLETATKDFSDFVMAIVPNTLDNGAWPQGFDSAYKNSSAGYEKMEGTHYNKYGAYMTAAYVAEAIKENDIDGVVKGSNSTPEYFNFVKHILDEPFNYVEPSNRLSISKAKAIEFLLENVNPTDPDREYVQPDVAIKAIEDLKTKGEISSINGENWETWVGYCQEAREAYESLNYDLRDKVTNYQDLVNYEVAAKAARPQAIKVAVFSASEFDSIDAQTSLGGQTVTNNDHTFTFVDNTTDKKLAKYAKNGATFEFNQTQYDGTKSAVLLGGNKDYYIEFAVTGKCEITLVGVSGGSDSRTILMTNKDDANDKYAYDMTSSQSIVTYEIENSGTYRIKSKGSNIYLFYIIIEYYE
ncbi:MAG: InlB B-repeat-containing protein [Acholeplasmatales bacterium]|nr:InlB B-repeat-containing protein [Acholeplasmatales bacterium]